MKYMYLGESGRDRVRVAAAVSGPDAGGARDNESGQGEERGEGCGDHADQERVVWAVQGSGK